MTKLSDISRKNWETETLKALLPWDMTLFSDSVEGEPWNSLRESVFNSKPT